MQPTAPAAETSSTNQSPRFTWNCLGWILIAAPMVGLVWAWVGHRVQPHFAPLLLFPILLGVASGITIVGLIRFAQFGHRPTIILAALIAALTAAAGEHYFNYLAAYRWTTSGVHGEGGAELSAIARQYVPGFGDYLRLQASHGRPLWGDLVVQGGWAWFSWAFDALLTAAAAVLVTLPALRVPYCNRCGSWYRTVRNGKVDVETGRRLAEICGIEDDETFRSPRYRLTVCQGGCSPTRCELSWEESSSAVNVARVWLTAEQRRQVAAVLDDLPEQQPPLED